MRYFRYGIRAKVETLAYWAQNAPTCFVLTNNWCVKYFRNAFGIDCASNCSPPPILQKNRIKIMDFGESGPIRCCPFMRFIDQGRRFICNSWGCLGRDVSKDVFWETSVAPSDCFPWNQFIAAILCYSRSSENRLHVCKIKEVEFKTPPIFLWFCICFLEGQNIWWKGQLSFGANPVFL